MHTLIVSKENLASMTIYNVFLEEFGFKKTDRKFDDNFIYESPDKEKKFQLVLLNKFQLFADYINNIDTDFFIFPCSHSSEAGVPALTVHPIGNFNKAELGGKDRTIVPTSAIVNKQLLQTLQEEAKNANCDFPVTMEAVHHGPFVEKPAVFAEMGSSKEVWENKNYGKIIASTILNGFNFPVEKNKKYKVAIGVGGTHYCSMFTKIQLETEIAISYVLPKHQIDDIDYSTFQQLIDKTVEGVDVVLLEWKSLKGSHREKILSFCEKLKVPYEKAGHYL